MMTELTQSGLENEIMEKLCVDFAPLSAACHIDELEDKTREGRVFKKDLTAELLIYMLRSPLDERNRHMTEALRVLKDIFGLFDLQLAKYCGLKDEEFMDLEASIDSEPLTKREIALLSILQLKDLLVSVSNRAQLQKAANNTKEEQNHENFNAGS